MAVYDVEIFDLPAATAVNAADDLLGVVAGPVTKRTGADTLADLQTERRWVLYDGTATIAAVNELAVTDTSRMAVGLPVRYTFGGTAYYGIITEISPNSLITICGPLLTLGATITLLEVGSQQLVRQWAFKFSGVWNVGAPKNLLAARGQYRKWWLGRAHIVYYGLYETSSGTPAVSPVTPLGNLNTGLEIQTASTWRLPIDGGEIDATKYTIDPGDTFELRSLHVDAAVENLSVVVVFVLE